MIRFRGFIQSVLRGRSSFLFIISVASFIATCQFIVSYNAMKSNHKGSDSDNHGFSLAFLQSLVNFSTTSIPSDVVHELSKPKYILYWNEAYGSTKYGFCCGQEPFVKYDCPVNNCFATDNRSFFGSEADVSSFDAIVFHQRSLNQEDLPRSRLRDQRYVMFMLESAHYPFGFAGPDWNGFFNWTMTYRKDSDFPMVYGQVLKTKDHPQSQEELRKLIRNFGRQHSHLAKRKKAKVAWFVSNCETQSQREQYVAQLQKHIQVDIFGACGPKRCHRQDEDKCWKMVEDDYKFYLSFENSLCIDYVTEKFFNAMRRNVVPITLGGGNYSDIAPYHSTINVYHEHDNPVDLARLLHDLDQNDEKYAEYFWWKDYYEVRMGDVDRAQSFCNLCQALNQNKPPKIYSDMEDWWFRKARCRHHHIRSNH